MTEIIGRHLPLSNYDQPCPKMIKFDETSDRDFAFETFSKEFSDNIEVSIRSLLR